MKLEVALLLKISFNIPTTHKILISIKTPKTTKTTETPERPDRFDQKDPNCPKDRKTEKRRYYTNFMTGNSKADYGIGVGGLESDS